MAPSPTISAALASRFDLLKEKLRLLEPPAKPVEMDDDALRALDLYNFVRLEVPSSTVPLHRDILIDFIFFFKNNWRLSKVGSKVVSVHKDMFRQALGFGNTGSTSSMAPPLPNNLTHETLYSTAIKFIETYIFPAHTRSAHHTGSGTVGKALRRVSENKACDVDWAGLIFKVAKKEIIDMMSKKRNIFWDCFYAGYWLRLIRMQHRNLFMRYIIAPSTSLHAAGTNVSTQLRDVLVHPGARPNYQSLRTTISIGSPRASIQGEGMDCIPEFRQYDGAGTSAKHSRASMSSTGGRQYKLLELSSVALALEEAGGHQPSVERTEELLELSNVALALVEAEGYQPSVERTKKVNNYATDTPAPRNSKRKIGDGYCGEISSDQHGSDKASSSANKIIKEDEFLLAASSLVIMSRHIPNVD